MIIESVDHETEGHVLLVLGSSPLEHQHSAVPRLLASRDEERALANARLAEKAESPAGALLGVPHSTLDGGELLLAADQLHRRSLVRRGV